MRIIFVGDTVDPPAAERAVADEIEAEALALAARPLEDPVAYAYENEHPEG